MASPTLAGVADVGVREARARDADEIGRIQVATWRTAYARAVPAHVLAQVTEELAAAQWRAAVETPPSPAHHVLVAYERDWTVGFAAVAPSDDEGAGRTTATVEPLLVEPRWGRRGHGSRLLAAAVAHARADGATTATTWLLVRDTASLAFFGSAGWERDGTARSLDMDGQPVDELRLHTDLTESAVDDPASGVDSR